MYKLKIIINSDNDFCFKKTEFLEYLEDKGTTKCYFENRSEAIKVIIEAIKMFAETFQDSEWKSFPEIKKWAHEAADKIELVCKKFPTFFIEKGFGNQWIYIELGEVEKQEIFGGFTYVDNKGVDFGFRYDRDIASDGIYWDRVAELPDVEE